MLRRLLLGGALSACAMMGGGVSAAQDPQAWYFGWAHARSGTTYVTASVARMSQYDRSQADERLQRALLREGVAVSDLTARHVGMPGDMAIDDAGDADTERLRFIQRERGRGQAVSVIPW